MRFRDEVFARIENDTVPFTLEVILIQLTLLVAVRGHVPADGVTLTLLVLAAEPTLKVVVDNVYVHEVGAGAGAAVVPG